MWPRPGPLLAQSHQQARIERLYRRQHHVGESCKREGSAGRACGRAGSAAPHAGEATDCECGAGGAGAPRVSLEHNGRERELHGAAPRQSGPGRGPAKDLCLLRKVNNDKARVVQYLCNFLLLT